MECSFVNKSFNVKNMIIGGIPAKVLKSCEPWIKECKEDVELCELIKRKMGLEYLV